MLELLNKEYDKLKNKELSASGKVNVLNNIIQIKLNEPHLKTSKNALSIDIKSYINALVELAENGARNYDKITPKKVMHIFDSVNLNEKTEYLNYLIRTLEKSSFNKELKVFQSIKHKTVVKSAFKKPFELKKITNIIINVPLINFYTLTGTIILFFLTTSILLLPAPLKSMEVLNLDIKYVDYSKNLTLNHFLNISTFLLGMDSDFKIVAKNSSSLMILMIGKVFSLLYVSIVLFNKLSDLIKRQ